jgi:hypothetical protein
MQSSEPRRMSGAVQAFFGSIPDPSAVWSSPLNGSPRIHRGLYSAVELARVDRGAGPVQTE